MKDSDCYDEERNLCHGCGRDEMDDGWCPLCCSNGGWYAPGTEDCDFCPHDNECAEFQHNF